MAKIRLAVVADIHWHEQRRASYRHHFDRVHEFADVLVLPGDLTGQGLMAEARSLAEQLAKARIPMVAVLGNHDVHARSDHSIIGVLADAGAVFLNGATVTLKVGDLTVGFAGTKGFCGGFGARCLTPFGEQEIKDFIGVTREEAAKLEEGLGSLQAEVRVVVLHYSPVAQTLDGEPAELYPFLGSSLLSEPIDRLGADIILHGHAHHGVERGTTQAGIPVRNTALPVIGRSWAVYELER